MRLPTQDDQRQNPGRCFRLFLKTIEQCVRVKYEFSRGHNKTEPPGVRIQQYYNNIVVRTCTTCRNNKRYNNNVIRRRGISGRERVARRRNRRR